MKLILILLFPTVLFSQIGFMPGMDEAYKNAQTGIFWALDNIPAKKASTSNELISGDTLLAEVKLNRESNGVHIESTGYYNSYTVKVCFFRSYTLLRKEGYLKE